MKVRTFSESRVTRFHVKSFGCQMNVYDSARMADVLRASGGYEATDELTIGLLAHALVKKYDPEKGWLYWLTGWERYALRDAQEAGMIPQKASPSQRLSGEQLFAIMTDAEEFATKRSEWEKGEKK